MLAAAHRLSSLGVPVHWLYGPTDPRPQRPDGSYVNERLDKRGKTPVGKGWQKRGWTDPTELFNTYEDGFNLGIHTGRVEGTQVNLLALDLDNEAALDWANKGGIPETPLIVRTFKGQHWYYLIPEGFPLINNSYKKIKPEPYLEIDVIADGADNGGNLVAAPSTHFSGFRYEELEPFNAYLIRECPEAGDWLLKLVEPTTKVIAMPGIQVGQEPSKTDPTTLFRARKYAASFDPAISGKGGSQTCFRLAQALICGFLLSPGEALAVMKETWNGKCCDEAGHSYPWSDEELLHKLDDAARSERLPGAKGWLLEKKTGSLAERNVSHPEPVADIKFAQLKKRLTPQIQKLINRGLLKDERCELVHTRKPDGSKIGHCAILDQTIPAPAMFVCDDIAEQFLMGGQACGFGYVLTQKIADAVALVASFEDESPGVICGSWENVLPLLSRLKPGAKLTLIDPPTLSPELIDRHRIRQMSSAGAALLSKGEKEVLRQYEQAKDYGSLEDDALDIPANLPDRKPWECNDEGNGKRLVAYFGEHIKYCSQLGRWFIWDGQKWRADHTGQIDELAKKTRALIIRHEADFAVRNGDKDLQKTLTDWYQKTGSRDRRQAMVKDAATDPSVAIREDQLDTARWEINCPNGVLDLRSGEMTDHGTAKHSYHTKICGAEYKVDAECPLWEKCLDRWMMSDKEMISYIQRMAGWMLSGDLSEQALFLMIGEGSNGKSTLVRVLMEILKDYAQSAPTSLILAAMGDDHQNTSPSALAAVARLKGARAVIVTESSAGQRLGAGAVKALTSKEAVPAKFMGQNFFEYLPSHKTILQTNHRPIIPDGDHGIWRRVKLIEFGVRIADHEKDTRLEEKLLKEREGILAWMVRGCLEFQKVGLNDPERVVAAVSQYRADMDPLNDFLADCAESTKEGFTAPRLLNRVYKEWYEENKGMDCDGKVLGFLRKNLETRGYKQGRGGKGVRGWQGIKLFEGTTWYQRALRGD